MSPPAAAATPRPSALLPAAAVGVACCCRRPSRSTPRPEGSPGAPSRSSSSPRRASCSCASLPPPSSPPLNSPPPTLRRPRRAGARRSAACCRGGRPSAEAQRGCPHLRDTHPPPPAHPLRAVVRIAAAIGTSGNNRKEAKGPHECTGARAHGRSRRDASLCWRRKWRTVLAPEPRHVLGGPHPQRLLGRGVPAGNTGVRVHGCTGARVGADTLGRQRTSHGGIERALCSVAVAAYGKVAARRLQRTSSWPRVRSGNATPGWPRPGCASRPAQNKAGAKPWAAARGE